MKMPEGQSMPYVFPKLQRRCVWIGVKRGGQEIIKEKER
jgi:hypothetical protein